MPHEKVMLFEIHHFGVINIFMGLLGRHRLHGDQPLLRASRTTASPSKASTTSQTSTIWELADNEAAGQDLITPELLKMMGPPPCEHHAECKLFVPGTCQRRTDPKIHGVEEKGSDRIPRSRLQPGPHAGPRKFYDFTPLARPYTSGEKESIDRRKTYTGMVPQRLF